MPQQTVKYLKDYQQPNYWVDTIDLTFILNVNQTMSVISLVHYYKNPTNFKDNSLILNGCAKLINIALNEKVLNETQYCLNLEAEQLSLANLPDRFSLRITTQLEPWSNQSCMGLYASHNNLLTQCEPEGFRKITFYLDRPDVMANFSTTIIVPANQYTTLLSNGNKVLEEINPQGQKIVKWVDPFKKPCYLFALVIGNFAVLRDTYTTSLGCQVSLEIYSEEKTINSCAHALHSLKRAMKWDETRFNLAYDLDTYMIVATPDFNMGAMENKGLNIFNTKYVLAHKDTATDMDFINVEAVIGHEYFHNWTGNRVTCRDWFQLSLKEGLTVFRDHEFTANMHNYEVKRIMDVKRLQQFVFTEDNGPLAHPVRPESYMEINNFYTSTVYEKGSEVVRMYQTILGKQGFNQGLELYLKRYDGSAATCEDFCQSMQEANNFDLTQFMLWYSQAGTPQVTVTAVYAPIAKTYTLEFEQTIPATSNQEQKLPMLIPIQIGLIQSNGQEIYDLHLSHGNFVKPDGNMVLLLTKRKDKFVFTNIATHPIPSLLRGFCAPIKLNFNYTAKEKLFLVKHDSDAFNRWKFFQIIMMDQIKLIYQHLINKKNLNLVIDEDFWLATRQLLSDANLAAEFKALAFQLPTFLEMLTEISQVNPLILTQAINYLAQQIGENLFDTWMEVYNLSLSLSYDFNEHGKRSLKNTALFYILKALSQKLDNPKSLQLIETLTLGQYRNADNMTDSLAVLTSINDLDLNLRAELLQEFYVKWQDNELVMDKWFAIQALSNLISTDELNKLMVNKAFIATNPNKIYALLRNFTLNGLKFNTEEGYSFIADKIIAIDKFNPQVASALAHGFNNVVYLNDSYHILAINTLQRVLNQVNLSNEVYEIISKTIQGLK